MKHLEKRICDLETRQPKREVSLSHVTDQDLDRMEEILSRTPLDMDAGEAAFFQGYGFLADINEGDGTLCEWVAMQAGDNA